MAKGKVEFYLGVDPRFEGHPTVFRSSLSQLAGEYPEWEVVALIDIDTRGLVDLSVLAGVLKDTAAALERLARKIDGVDHVAEIVAEAASAVGIPVSDALGYLQD